MKKIPFILIISLIGLLTLTACSSTNASATPVTATLFPEPTATAVMVLPTPSSPGDSILWQDLQVILDETEISDEYISSFGSTRSPSPGMKFLWAHIQLRNMGQIEISTPLLENYSVLYAGTELKPSYGYRQDYKDYSTLDPALFPNQKADGWIRFDVPTAAGLNELLCVFLPESSQIGTSYSSPNYPYPEDKPTYVWKCAP